MNPAKLLAHFERLAEAPDAVPRLRRFILDLAVRGKLVERDPNDIPVAELLKGIETERDRVNQSGKRRIVNDCPIASDEVPFPISAGMVFARLASVARIEKGATGIQKAMPGQYPLVTLAESRATSSDYQFDAAAAIVPLISSTGHGHASLKRMHYQEGKFALGNILCAVLPFAPDLISARYLYEYLWAYKESLLVEKMIGTANVSLTIGKIGEAPIPIINPRSQTRLHELMSLCDRLEAALADRESQRDLLVRASLHRLNQSASDAATFRHHARFHLQHLPRTASRPEHIGQLRQTILNLAVHGKLVPRDPNDEPVPTIGTTFASSAGVDSYIFSDAFTSLTLPPHWSAKPLVEVAAALVDCPHSTPKWTDAGKICVRTNQFRPGVLDLSDVRFVDDDTYSNRIQRLQPVANDILYSREGGILGIACRVPPGVQLCLGQRMMLIRAGSSIDPVFLEFVLNSPLVTTIARAKTTGGAAPRVNVATIRAYPIPLPPFAEQRRIVAKVTELMALCDRLEAQLITTQTESRRLLEVVLHDALAPRDQDPPPCP